LRLHHDAAEALQEKGDLAQAGITNLGAASRFAPGDDAIRLALTEAYRRRSEVVQVKK
jgi:hypothetical protein